MKIESNLIRKIGATALGVFIIIYIIYQWIVVSYTGVSTETAMYTKVSDTINTQAWFVRDDKIVTSTEKGNISFNVSDGEKVAKGDAIANIYADEETAAALLQIEKIEEEISDLENLTNSFTLYNLGEVQFDSAINAKITDLLIDINENDYEGYYEGRNDLANVLNQSKIVTGEEEALIYSQRINELNSQKQDLLSLLTYQTGYIYSPYSGYYVSETDGYEESFDYDEILDISVSDIENIAPKENSDLTIGRVSSSFVWYVVMVISEEDNLKLRYEDSIELAVPAVSDDKFKMDIEAVNFDEESGNYALVLSSNIMNEEIASLRNEEVSLVVSEYEGVLVSEDNIHFETVIEEVYDEDGNVVDEIEHENVKGVFVKYGQKITFVQIFSEITIDGYAVCKLQLAQNEKDILVTNRSIELYDEVVVQGDDLYDGKIL